MKKTHNALIKFKVALACLIGQPITEICKQYEVASSSVHKWKTQLKRDGAIVFGQGAKTREEQHEAEVAKLYQRIGQLTTELEFLKKVVGA
jgi:transposase